LAHRVEVEQVDVVIVDDDLSPAQIRVIEEACRC
jgi:50S ribosomal subunit-associated GTPase HflX